MADAEFAKDKDRRSRFGYIMTLGSHVIHFKSKKLQLVCLSTTEAELLSFVVGLQEFIHLLQLLKFCAIKVTKPLAFCDNEPAVRILHDLQSINRTKHLDIRILFSRQYLDIYSIQLSHIGTNYNWADGFTKPLQKQKFTEWLSSLGRTSQLGGYGMRNSS